MEVLGKWGVDSGNYMRMASHRAMATLSLNWIFISFPRLQISRLVFGNIANSAGLKRVKVILFGGMALAP